MKKIITISREFGSGGRSIAKAVAKELGYEYFDVEMMEQLAQTKGIDSNEIEVQKVEGAGTTFFGSLLAGKKFKENLNLEDALWTRQRDMILDIAERGNCVIVGRCADYILRDYKEALHVFIHADLEYRMERIVRLYGETNETPERRLIEKDRRRAANYRYYTDREWGLSKNYDLALSSSKLGHERCKDIIVGIARAE